VPHPIRSAYDRIAPMIRFFRHGDGALALFNGGVECDSRMIAGLLARDEVRGLPFAYARHSGYHRLTAAKTLALLDCGTVPRARFDPSPCSVPGSRAEQRRTSHRRQLRRGGFNQPQMGVGAACDRCAFDVDRLRCIDGGNSRARHRARPSGPRMIGGPAQIETRRVETTQGWSVEASHDGYMVPTACGTSARSRCRNRAWL